MPKKGLGNAGNVYICVLMAGIYVHIPFCASRCSYCDFFSTLRLSESGEPYVNALLAEAALRQTELQGEPIRTLYLGWRHAVTVAPAAAVPTD